MTILMAQRLGAVCLCMALMTGCMTARHLPGTQPQPMAGTAALPASLSVQQPKVDIRRSAMLSGEAKTVSAAVSRHLSNWTPGSGAASAPTLNLTLEHDHTKMNWGSFFGYLVTLTLIPAWDDHDFKSVLTVNAGGRELYRSEVHEKVRSYLSVYFPTPLFIGVSHSNAMQQMADASMARHHAALEQWVVAERQAFEQQVAGKSLRAQRDWLAANPDTLFRNVVLEKLATNPQGRDRLAWHRDNLSRFPDYAQFVPQNDAIWFVGPAGNRVIDIHQALRRGEAASIVAARIRATGAPYRAFTSAETARLRNNGIPSSVIAAMIEASASHTVHATAATPVRAVAARAAPATVAHVVIRNNSGQYMCPWTSDGVLAEWVDKAINAKMGAAAGGAIGAYAGAKAMENVPFVGGFLGSKVGSASGRALAIQAAGGEQYIRQTSDLSFNSLDDMARYIQTTYAGSSHYQQAIKAADEIYPGLMKALARVSMN